jgi:hypothetical protein
MVLLFKDSGWDVMTTSWTASAKPEMGKTQLVYLWSGDGPQRITVAISYKDFLARVMACAAANTSIVDLRDLR